MTDVPVNQSISKEKEIEELKTQIISEVLRSINEAIKGGKTRENPRENANAGQMVHVNNTLIETFVPPKPQVLAIILTESMDFESWKRHARVEIKGFRLELLIFDDISWTINMSEDAKEGARGWLYTYLSARIADEFRRTNSYENINDPKEMWKKLEQIKNPINTLTEYAANRVWSAIVYDPMTTGEKVEQFID